MDELILTIGLILAILSLFVTTFVIFLHFWMPKLRRHPGQFVLIQCVFQFCYDLHWLAAYPKVSQYLVEKPSACVYAALFTDSSFNLGLFYTCVLSIELIIKVNRSASFAYYKRSIFYHFFAVVFIISLESLYVVIGAFGKTKFDTCGLSSAEAEIIENIPQLISFIILLFSLFYLFKKLFLCYSKLMWNYFLIIFCVELTWQIPTGVESVRIFIQNTITVDIVYLIGTMSGILVGLARLIDGKIYRELRQRYLPERKKSIMNYVRKQFVITGIGKAEALKEGLMKNQEELRCSESICCFADLFESMSKKVINRQMLLEIASVLFVHFSEFAKIQEESLEKKDKTDGFVYSNFEFSKLRYILSEREINYCN
jgi:hypothetical protein